MTTYKTKHPSRDRLLEKRGSRIAQALGIDARGKTSSRADSGSHTETSMATDTERVSHAALAEQAERLSRREPIGVHTSNIVSGASKALDAVRNGKLLPLAISR